MIVNGREYPLWSQLVERKNEYIGGMLQDLDCEGATTIIQDITLTPNGVDSAFFQVIGEEFECGFDCKHGGITSGEQGWLTFSGYAGHEWRIKPLYYRCDNERI